MSNNKKTSQARGIRNNNPLNIRVGNDWQGERKPNTDGAFEHKGTKKVPHITHDSETI